MIENKNNSATNLYKNIIQDDIVHYISALTIQAPGNLEFRSEPGHILRDLLMHWPTLAGWEIQAQEMCKLIIDAIYPLAGSLLARLVEIKVAISSSPLFPTPVTDALATYIVFDTNKRTESHDFVSPSHPLSPDLLSGVATGIIVSCSPLYYHFLRIKDGEEKAAAPLVGLFERPEWLLNEMISHSHGTSHENEILKNLNSVLYEITQSQSMELSSGGRLTPAAMLEWNKQLQISHNGQNYDQQHALIANLPQPMRAMESRLMHYAIDPSLSPEFRLGMRRVAQSLHDLKASVMDQAVAEQEIRHRQNHVTIRILPPLPTVSPVENTEIIENSVAENIFIPLVVATEPQPQQLSNNQTSVAPSPTPLQPAHEIAPIPAPEPPVFAERTILPLVCTVSFDALQNTNVNGEESVAQNVQSAPPEQSAAEPIAEPTPYTQVSPIIVAPTPSPDVLPPLADTSPIYQQPHSEAVLLPVSDENLVTSPSSVILNNQITPDNYFTPIAAQSLPEITRLQTAAPTPVQQAIEPNNPSPQVTENANQPSPQETTSAPTQETTQQPQQSQNTDKPAAKESETTKQDSQPTEENKPAGDKPAEQKPADNKPTENKPAEKKPAENKPTDNNQNENKPVENKSAENKPAENKQETQQTQSNERTQSQPQPQSAPNQSAPSVQENKISATQRDQPQHAPSTNEQAKNQPQPDTQNLKTQPLKNYPKEQSSYVTQNVHMPSQTVSQHATVPTQADFFSNHVPDHSVLYAGPHNIAAHDLANAPYVRPLSAEGFSHFTHMFDQNTSVIGPLGSLQVRYALAQPDTWSALHTLNAGVLNSPVMTKSTVIPSLLAFENSAHVTADIHKHAVGGLTGFALMQAASAPHHDAYTERLKTRPTSPIATFLPSLTIPPNAGKTKFVWHFPTPSPELTPTARSTRGKK